IEAIFETNTSMASPFPSRIGGAATATEDIWSKAGGLERPTGYQTSLDLIDEVMPIIRDINIGPQAEFMGKEVIQPHAATPKTIMPDVRVEKIGQVMFAVDVAAKHVKGELVGRVFVRGLIHPMSAPPCRGVFPNVSSSGSAGHQEYR